jgi:AraC-like DNA-binding protein
LERQFAKRLGNPPHAWLNELRLDRACELLLQGYYVKAAAHELGFRSAAHFCRTFKLRYGATPRAFVVQQAKNVAFRG